MSNTCTRLIAALLNAHCADYKLVDHEPEGATDVVGALRGHPVAHAAKCLLLMAKVDKRTRRFVLAVGPGDQRHLGLDDLLDLVGIHRS